ncbi:unnamed protein product [Caenorhabditis sp. 36 PRJEB53466]|nr:unnamed protein product [Caenorhabditis sp. 36 PRJEB53466]
MDYIESPKKPRVVWPGEFENQLKKRDRNLTKLENRESGRNTPAVNTPSDSGSVTSEDPEEEKPKKEIPRGKPKKVKNANSFLPPPDTHYMDEYLDPPKKLNPSSGGSSFFLVSSNLVNE